MRFRAAGTMILGLGVWGAWAGAASEGPEGSGDAGPASAGVQISESGCVECHKGIEWIRDPESGMMKRILKKGAEAGDPAGCVVCHGGDPKQRADKALAHRMPFYPDPGSPWINDKTCGRCHKDHVRVQWQSLMMTEAGKIQGTCWAFGMPEGYKHRWANYAVRNPESPDERLGTPAYRKYMERLAKLEPDVFVSEHEALPEAPGKDDLAKLKDNPSPAGFTYLRQECQRCHTGVKGRQKRGDYRGMGCSSCHMPYGNEGFYEGGDPTIDRKSPGHPLVHMMQGTREAKVKAKGGVNTGIPVETCTTCHNRGKRIGVSYQGLMESAYKSPFATDGSDQPALHSKHYIAMQQDVHYRHGMVCQDCHVSLDVHGDGFLRPTNLAAVQIECTDCHGTPDKFPWELPLGYMDEFAEKPAQGPARGVSGKPLPMARAGAVGDPNDGFLLTTRGTPYENVVRDGDEVIVRLASGKDLRLSPLKKSFRDGKISIEGRVAMQGVAKHMDRLECYTCHAGWVPQCYGCHVKVDYTQKDKCPEAQKSLEAFDWVAAGRKHAAPEHAADDGESGYSTLIPGKVEEQRSYLRWEEPMLGINGEGRVTPLEPGCQVAVTVIGEDGVPVLLNHVFKTPPGTERGGKDGQIAIDMSPTQPHTVTGKARSCESCHASAKALGLGIPGTRPWNEEHTVDLETPDGKVLPGKSRPQMEKIENLDHDWSQIVDEEGNQLATVGHHFQLSRAFDKAELQRISREGTCLACHKEIPSESLAVSFLHHVAEYAGKIPATPEEHAGLLHKILVFSAWGQTVLALGLPLAAIGGVFWWTRRKKRADRTPANR